jgi:hypothetical protein
MKQWEIDFCFYVEAETEEDAINKARSIATIDLETADIVAHNVTVKETK